MTTTTDELDRAPQHEPFSCRLWRSVGVRSHGTTGGFIAQTASGTDS